METKPIILNLGCGNKIYPDAINIDFASNWSGRKPDVEADLRKLPFPDNYADEAHAIHVIEHFFSWEVIDVLKEWHRVLKPGGLLVIECPDLNKVIHMLIDGTGGPQKTFLALYGEQRSKDPNMVHKWCYTKTQLEEILGYAGFKEIEEKTARFHVPKRDIRVECRK